jgi:hypothetical protein
MCENCARGGGKGKGWGRPRTHRLQESGQKFRTAATRNPSSDLPWSQSLLSVQERTRGWEGVRAISMVVFVSRRLKVVESGDAWEEEE